MSLVDDEESGIIGRDGGRGGGGNLPLAASPIPEVPTATRPISPPVATSIFMCLDRQNNYDLELPNLPVQELQESFENIHKLYTETVFANRQKIDECVLFFKRILGVHPQLHMRECFRTWKGKIVQPIFKITFTEDKRYVKEIVVKAERGNIPQEIWSAQKFIREILHGCHLFLDQYIFFQNSIHESFHKIQHSLKNLGSLTDGTPSLKKNRQSIHNQTELLLNQYQQISGIVSRFEEEIKQLITEITDSVDILNK